MNASSLQLFRPEIWLADGHRPEGRLKRRTAHERNAEPRAAEVANNTSERRKSCRLRGFLVCR
jgi:hypothetical protein